MIQRNCIKTVTSPNYIRRKHISRICAHFIIGHASSDTYSVYRMIAAGDTTKQKAADSAWRNWRREEENERSEVSPQLRTEGSRIAVYTRAVAVTTVVR